MSGFKFKIQIQSNLSKESTGLSLRHCTRWHCLSRKCCRGLKPLATWCPISWANKVSNYQIKSFIILAEPRRSVLRVCWGHFLVIAPGQHSFFWRIVLAVASHWQHCFRFDGPEIWTLDFPLQRQTRYSFTNWLVEPMVWASELRAIDVAQTTIVVCFLSNKN